MLRKLAIRATLFSYSVIALFGQGLHEWMEHDDDASEQAASVAVCVESSNALQLSGSETHEHDCDHCAICQHHSLGQIFVAAPPAEIVLGVCELLSPPVPEPVVCPAHFSPAQPRAPPVV
jgi:hypothetical protein